jgi:hypothetical protein
MSLIVEQWMYWTTYLFRIHISILLCLGNIVYMNIYVKTYNIITIYSHPGHCPNRD